DDRQRMFSETTVVKFRALDAVKIRRYLNKVIPLDKAGGYGIQEDGDSIIGSVAGSYSNVVGLPLERLNAGLHAWEGTVPQWQASLSSGPGGLNVTGGA